MAETAPIAPEKMARLKAFLGALPAPAAAKLFSVLELGFARGGDDLPYEEMLETLRAHLFNQDASFPRRPMSAQRLFFEPFEDFIIAEHPGAKRRARIARTSFAPIWALIKTDAVCVNADRALQKLTEALVVHQRDGEIDGDARAVVRGNLFSLWRASAQGFGRIVERAEADDGFRKALSERLGGPAAYHDLVEMQMILGGAHHVRAVQTSFAAPVEALSDDELYRMRQIYEATREEAPDAAAYALLCLACRMDKPWRALGVYYYLVGARSGEGRQVEADASVIPEMLFDDLEGAARTLEKTANGDFDAVEAQLALAHFVELADGIEAEANRYKDPVVVNRVEACRDVAAEAVERFTEQSIDAMRRAMPVRKASGSSRLMALRPDIGRAVSPTLAREAREAVDFLARINEEMQRLNRNKSVDGLVDEARRQAEQYASDLVTEIRAAEGEGRKSARRLMDHTLRLIEPLFSDEEIGLIRDRASAAAVSA